MNMHCQVLRIFLKVNQYMINELCTEVNHTEKKNFFCSLSEMFKNELKKYISVSCIFVQLAKVN